jgi:uncharacterized repeat protein (TIGR01451 family)
MSAVYVDTSRDCDKYAVMYCGAMTKDEMVKKMNNGDGRNSSANIKNIFSQFGLNVTSIKNANFKDGVVYQNGDVKVGGKVVAKNAQTYIRTLGGKGSTSRMGSAQAAKVAVNKDGQFLFAVMTPCGNPVTGKNVVPKPPEPIARCDTLKATKISRDTFRFDVTATAKNGAKITKYTYSFGDGKTTSTSSTSVKHTYAKAGTYTATVKVHFNIDGKSVSRTCKTTVTVQPQPPKPTPKVPGVSIDKTVNGKEYEMVELNKPFNYRVVVKNNGEVALKDAVVTDEAPQGITFTATDKGTIVNNSLKYTITSLAVGGSETINITAVMKEYVEGKIVNTACVETPTVPGGNPDDCDDATVETKEPKVEVCDLTTGKIVTIPESEADDERYTTDLSLCEKIEVCDLTTGEIVTIQKSEADDERYTTDLSLCDEIEVCDLTTGEIVTIQKSEADDERYTTDLSQCEQIEVCDVTTGEIVTINKSEADDERYVDVDDEACNPPVKGEVTELPTTGLVQTLSSFVGLSSLAAASAYYYTSRRA